MIIPAVVPKSLTDLRAKIELLSFAEHLQIDVVDGKFDDDVSWPYTDQSQVAEASALISDHTIEVDLMVSDPITAGRDWLEAGATSLIFHIESLNGLDEVLELKSQRQFSLGFSLGNDTTLDQLHDYISHADFIQLMGIKEIGSQGQPFDFRVLERLASLRHLYPKMTLSVDGGLNEETIDSVRHAGANRFVVGSAITKADDPGSEYEKLLKIIG